MVLRAIIARLPVKDWQVPVGDFEMDRITQSKGFSRGKLLLVLPPFVSALSFPIGIILGHELIGVSFSYWQAMRIAGLCYAIGLAVLLFIERDVRLTQASDARRPLEVVIALAGLGIAISFLSQFFHTDSWDDLRYGLFSAIASGTFLVPARTGKIRALAFALMGIATVHPHPISSRPPFISLAIVCVAAAVACLFPLGKNQTATRRLFSVPTIVCTFLTVTGLSGLKAAHQTSSISGMVIFSAIILFFGIGTIAIVVRGPSRERQSKP
jgi:hypothetical protein